MIDSATREKMVVSTDGVAGPYIMVPVDQLERIESILGNNNVTYWVDADAISLDGKPEITVINFGRAANVARIQRVLDSTD